MQPLNIIFTGDFQYPQGMAGTKRNQHAINFLHTVPGVSLRVFVLRQSSNDNLPNGQNNGVDYETVSPDMLGSRLIYGYPWTIFRAMKRLKRYYVKGKKNILHVYGPPSFDNIIPILFAKKIGYKILFDIVEDYDLAFGISASLSHKLQNKVKIRLINSLSRIADGVIVISSHLLKKYTSRKYNKVPVHFRPISIDLDQYLLKEDVVPDRVKLFYSGSFGLKDGVEKLFDAFELIAKKYDYVDLIMVGKAEDSRIKKIFDKIDSSVFSNRIFYKGYVSDEEYYKLLSQINIPCMTRIDLDYANAGFPFKLGEFLATGKPVIASKVSDVGEYLVDKHNAKLIEPSDDSRQLYKAIDFLLNNPEKSTIIGKYGRETAKSNFDYLKQGKELLSFFDNI